MVQGQPKKEQTKIQLQKNRKNGIHLKKIYKYIVKHTIAMNEIIHSNLIDSARIIEILGLLLKKIIDLQIYWPCVSLWNSYRYEV